MTGPQLEDKAIGIIRGPEPGRERIVKVSLVLLIHVATVSKAETVPAFREDPEAADDVPGIILKGILGSAADVLDASNFHDRLEPSVDGEIDRGRDQKLVRTIKKRRVKSIDVRFYIRIPMISNVSGNINVLANASVKEKCSHEIASVAARACTVEQLSDSRIGTVVDPAIRTYNTCADRTFI